MRLDRHLSLRVLTLALCLPLLGACGANPSGARSAAPRAAAANRGTPARGVCSAVTEDVAAITGLRLRQPPLDISDPGEGLLRGCAWTEEGGGLNVFSMTKETADKFEKHDADNYRRNFPERFKPLEGYGDRAYVTPNVNGGWAACALRGPENFFVEIEGKATTEEQARRLLRLALDRL